MNNLVNLQNKIGYVFKDINNLKTALTHQSYANEHDNVESYERLEFLGDAIIEMIVSKYIYDHIKASSGMLTKIRAYLVSTENLSKITLDLNLDKYMLSSKSLSTIGKKNCADLFESLIGAIYVDGGLEDCKKIIQKYIIISEEHINYAMQNCEDSKTQVQELFQKQGNNFEYKMVSSSGLDHEKIFKVELIVDSKVVARATGNSIREAEEKCAEKFLKSKKAGD